METSSVTKRDIRSRYATEKRWWRRILAYVPTCSLICLVRIRGRVLSSRAAYHASVTATLATQHSVLRSLNSLMASTIRGCIEAAEVLLKGFIILIAICRDRCQIARFGGLLHYSGPYSFHDQIAFFMFPSILPFNIMYSYAVLHNPKRHSVSRQGNPGTMWPRSDGAPLFFSWTFDSE